MLCLMSRAHVNREEPLIAEYVFVGVIFKQITGFLSGPVWTCSPFQIHFRGH